MKAMSFEPLIAEIESAGAKAILDLGCATAEFLRALDRPGYDLYRRGPERRRHRPGGAATSLVSRSMAGRWQMIRFAGVEFDAITMIDFIEHVRDPEAELRLAGQRLAPAVEVLISTPRSDSTWLRGDRPVIGRSTARST